MFSSLDPLLLLAGLLGLVVLVSGLPAARVVRARRVRSAARRRLNLR